MAASPPFDTSRDVVYGVPTSVAPLVRRVVAGNPGPMTFTGTATYLVGETDIALIDPGPDDADHADALLGALEPGSRISHILVTHSHRDHTGNVSRLRAETGAKVYAFGGHGAGRSATMVALAATLAQPEGEGVDTDFTPDTLLVDGDVVAGKGWQLRALHTPGHLGNHLCFSLEGTGVLFSGDAVMGWSTTVVSPPDGDMADFMTSLRRLAERNDTRFLPGHGAPIDDPGSMVAWQLRHRLSRERSIVEALGQGPATPEKLVRMIYEGLDPRLRGAAARNVLAHLLALEAAGRVRHEGRPIATARFLAL